MVICMLTAIRLLLSNRYKLITNVRSSLMAVNIHITIIELNALHTKRQNLFQELDAVIHLLMEAKHWGLRKSRNATSLNSRFKSPLDAINNVFRKFSAFHDETGRLNVDGMNIISNDGSNKLNRSRKARVSYKVQRTINASLNAATSTRAVSSNPNFVTRQAVQQECRDRSRMP